MKTTLRILSLAAALLAVTATLAAANPQTPRVDRRQAAQHLRIRDGVKHGQLTRGEAARLRTGQAHVRRMERRVKSDGIVTPRERARLGHAQDVQSRRIFRLKHNARGRC
jgi:hypothetical protein